jgi:L-rhamnose isomerase/sugar isomerase
MDWPDIIASQNAPHHAALEDDYAHLGRQLGRRGIEIERVTTQAAAFRVAVPSWGVVTGGTRFARFPMAGEPRTIFEKIDDCEIVQRLVRVTPGVSLHIPWDRHERPGELRAYLQSRGLSADSTNSNTFQDEAGQRLSYKFGSLCHTDPAVRRQAVELNLECLALAEALGASAHTVWIGDGGNFPGQVDFRRALDRYLESLRAIYAALPAGCRLFIEHKPYEPAFYSTVLSDWGTSYHCARELGDRCFALVDLGHHAPNVNIEMVVARLLQFGKLGGFHFNDSKYGDDDLDAGSIKPFQLFLILNELVDWELGGQAPAMRGGASPPAATRPLYMLDQSHNVTDPIESLCTSAMELVRSYVQALLIDRAALAAAQDANDAIEALRVLKRAFTTDVEPILAMARLRAGGAVDPVATYRASGYRTRCAAERGTAVRPGAGIV